MNSNKEYYGSDTPVNNQIDDKFQRYGFSKRIAETIFNREDSNSLVIGIYGSWGEGKTSVMNFIETVLHENENIVACKFNPWRFNDEGQMLTAFFSLLAKELDKSILTKKEKIAQKICDYGETFSMSFQGFKTGDLFKNYKNRNSVGIDEQKKRIEEILNKEKKKIVIFIDDIDRLDKSEIQSIFKLIKLTGDFHYTTYVLAFDHLMVAKAIGEIYEDGSMAAGKNFLEKIIQVPLQLPKAQISALREYCFDKINNAINSNNIIIPQGEAQRFNKFFNDYIISRLNTPRMAVRFGNAISFAVPLLYKEANLGDLLSIESIKIFYQDVYDFVKNNRKYFVKSYESVRIGSDNKANEERKENSKKDFQEVTKVYPSEEQKLIKELLIDLFPLFRQVFQGIGYGENSFAKWHDEKRIGSPDYFNRYFAYTVIKGEISDIEYENFIDEVSNYGKETSENFINDYINKVDTNTLALKLLLYKAEGYSSDLSKKLIQVFCKYGNKFEFNSNTMFALDTPLGKLAYVVYKLLKNIPDIKERLTIAIQFIKDSPSFNQANIFFSNFKIKKDGDGEDEVFTEEQINDLSIILLEKAKNESNLIPLFEKFPHESSLLLSIIWSRILGKADVMNYLKPILSEHPMKLAGLLKSYSPFGYSSQQQNLFFQDLQPQNFQFIIDTLDSEFLLSIALKAIKKDINEVEYKEIDGEPTDTQRIEQFISLFNKKV
jgi:hypothetical protein